MFANYIIYKEDPLPPIGGFLLEEVLAGNGLFLRAKRPGLSVQFPLCSTNVRGLKTLAPKIALEKRVGAAYLNAILHRSFKAMPDEILFYVLPADPYRVIIPPQEKTPISVTPLNKNDSNCAAALLEIHSHNSMEPFFSPTDDEDEANGFRLFAVLGQLNRTPTILTRVGVYGYFYEFPAKEVFDLPYGLADAFDHKAAWEQEAYD